MQDEAARQYATTANLAKRGSLHSRYGTGNWFGWLAREMRLAPGERVLDIGCGPGWFWRSVRDAVPADLHLTLADASPAMVKAAEDVDGFASVTVERADAAALPYGDATFDSVVAMHMLYHLDEPQGALAEMRRVLRPEGRIFVTTAVPESMVGLGRLGAAAFGGSELDPAAAIVSLNDLEAWLADGFERVERADFADTYHVTEAADAVAFLLSMPPGNAAGPEAVDRLCDLLEREIATHGAIEVTWRPGVVSAVKPAEAVRPT